jgi:hypothetical protein
MTLQVPFDDFVSTAQRFEIKDVYLLASPQFVEISGCDPAKPVTVLSQTAKSKADTKHYLEDHGLSVFQGIWSEHRVPLEEVRPELFVAAVSYQSGHPIPGLWVDAFEGEPTHVNVLQTLYHEFRSTGELPEVSIEEFLRAANPNVVVLSQARLRAFFDAKREKEPC